MATAELIEKLERAEGPSRELDAEIDSWLGWTPLPNPTSAGGLIDMMVSASGETTRRTVPHYTASIDAAMGLVPEGCMFDLGSDGPLGGPWACVTSLVEPCPDYSAHAANPAVALVIAALKAKEADNGKVR